MKHNSAYKYDYLLVKSIEKISKGVLCLFKIQNFYTICSEIGVNQYEDLFINFKQQLILMFDVDVFEYNYDSFFILASKLDIDKILKFINCYSYQNFNFYLVNCLGCTEFDLINEKENPIQIINNTIETLNYANKNDIKICYYHVLSTHIKLEKSYMHNSIMFKKHSKNDNLLLRFQPVVSVLDGKTLFNEALLKIKDVDRSIEEIIISLEKTGAINYLDMMVLNRIEEHIKMFPDKNFSINVSTSSIINDNECDAYIKKLQCFSNPQNLTLEITETFLKRDMQKIAEFTNFARKIGFKIAIDDFGSGNTSYKDLLYLNVDIIKLSGSIISNLDERSKKIIKFIYDITNTLNITLIAECVETKQTFETLTDLNISYMQGYYFSDEQTNKLQEIKLKSIT